MALWPPLLLSFFHVTSREKGIFLAVPMSQGSNHNTKAAPSHHQPHKSIYYNYKWVLRSRLSLKARDPSGSTCQASVRKDCRWGQAWGGLSVMKVHHGRVQCQTLLLHWMCQQIAFHRAWSKQKTPASIPSAVLYLGDAITFHLPDPCTATSHFYSSDFLLARGHSKSWTGCISPALFSYLCSSSVGGGQYQSSWFASRPWVSSNPPENSAAGWNKEGRPPRHEMSPSPQAGPGRAGTPRVAPQPSPFIACYEQPTSSRWNPPNPAIQKDADSLVVRSPRHHLVVTQG